MSTRGAKLAARIVERHEISAHLVRLALEAPGFASTGLADEWVGLIVPGQFQSRYYTVREYASGRLTLDIVVHDKGLVTEWAAGDVVGETVTLTEPKGSFLPPGDAGWLLLVGDLTALPAMARIEREATLPVAIHAEVPEVPAAYFSGKVTWHDQPGEGQSRLAEIVDGIEWPEGPGYFWMAGESAQMRAIRKHLMRERQMPNTHYDVMGYWRATLARQPRAVDPAPIYRAGRAAGKSDDQIWADYDAAREGSR